MCLENKIPLDHADIYGSYTTEAFGKAFASGKIAEKNTANIQMWDPNAGRKSR
jgi:predicted oxidoreductase